MPGTNRANNMRKILLFLFLIAGVTMSAQVNQSFDTIRVNTLRGHISDPYNIKSNSNFLPKFTSTWNLGSAALKWNRGYFTRVLADTFDITGLANGQLLWGGSDGRIRQSANLKWDSADNQLGINITPTVAFHMLGNYIQKDTDVISVAYPFDNGSNTVANTTIFTREIQARRSGSVSTLFRESLIYNGNGTTRRGKYVIGLAETSGFGSTQFLLSQNSANRKVGIMGHSVESYDLDVTTPSTAYATKAYTTFNSLLASGLGIVSIEDNGVSKIYVPASGNLYVGFASNSDFGRLSVRGAGATSSTYSATIHNSSGTNNAMMIRDDGRVGYGTTSMPFTYNFQGTMKVSTLAQAAATDSLVGHSSAGQLMSVFNPLPVGGFVPGELVYGGPDGRLNQESNMIYDSADATLLLDMDSLNIFGKVKIDNGSNYSDNDTSYHTRLLNRSQGIALDFGFQDSITSATIQALFMRGPNYTTSYGYGYLSLNPLGGGESPVFVNVGESYPSTFGAMTVGTNYGTTSSGGEAISFITLATMSFSGTARHTAYDVSSSITQTGGGNGVMRGLHVHPTLTNVGNYLAIALDSGKVQLPHIVISSSQTLKNTSFVSYTGTGDTLTLPNPAAVPGVVYRIKHRGTGTLTIVSTVGTPFFTTSAVASVALATGDQLEFTSDNTYWNVD